LSAGDAHYEGGEMTDRESPGEHFGKPGRKHDRVAAVDRQVRALQLRRSGATYDDIARAVGFASRSGAYKAVARALRERLLEGVDALRSLELERLDRLQLACWPAATANPPNLEATRTILRIMAARARLLGLNAATEIKGEILYRSMAEQIAREENVSVEQILAEAERIVDEARRGGA
jgi:hypothetical protein